MHSLQLTFCHFDILAILSSLGAPEVALLCSQWRNRRQRTTFSFLFLHGIPGQKHSSLLRARQQITCWTCRNCRLHAILHIERKKTHTRTHTRAHKRTHTYTTTTHGPRPPNFIPPTPTPTQIYPPSPPKYIPHSVYFRLNDWSPDHYWKLNIYIYIYTLP